MTQGEMHNAIASRLQTLVVSPQSLAVEWPNVTGFKRPEGSLWARVTFLGRDARQIEIGTPAKRFRVEGTVEVQIFGPLDKGEAPTVALATLIVRNFRAVGAAGVTYRTPGIYVLGRVGDWFQVNVSIPWYAEDTN